MQRRADDAGDAPGREAEFDVRAAKLMAQTLLYQPGPEAAPRGHGHGGTVPLGPAQLEMVTDLQASSTVPKPVDSAPYLTALVASSCSAIEIASAAEGRIRSSGPPIATLPFAPSA